MMIFKDKIRKFLFKSVVLTGALFISSCFADDKWPSLELKVVTESDIEVIAPKTHETPATKIQETLQFTGKVEWFGYIGVDGKFASSTDYSARITLTAKDGYTFKGVKKDFFTVTEALDGCVYNDEDSGVVIADFATTEAFPPDPVTISEITGLTAPVAGETPDIDIDETDQYQGTVSWSPEISGDAFDYGTNYTATITLKPTNYYTCQGLEENFFTVKDVSEEFVTYEAGTSEVKVTFPATEKSVNVNLSSIGLEGGELSPAFGSGIKVYNVNVANDTTSITITPIAEYSGATIVVTVGEVIKIPVLSKYSIENLAVGDNTIKIDVIAQDETIQKTYTVTVNRAGSSANEMTNFEIEESIKKEYDYTGKYITVTMPNNCDLTNPLYPTYTLSPNARLEVYGTNGMESKTSGDPISFNDGEAKTFRVTSQSGEQKDYIVIVNVAENSAKDITSFNITNLDPPVEGTISKEEENNTITLNVPWGTKLSQLNLEIVTSPEVQSVAVGQTNGTKHEEDDESVTFKIPSGLLTFINGSSKDFVVTAEDGTTKTYQVTVNVNDITDIQAVDAALNKFSALPNPITYADGDSEDSVTQDVILATADDFDNYDTEVTWSSGNESVITIDGSTGTVTRFDVDTEVTLTVNIEKGGETKTEGFTLTVKPIAITSITVSDLDIPAVGGSPDTGVSNVNEWTCESVTWDEGDGIPMLSTDTFEGSKIYTATLSLKANTGWIFKEVETVSLTVNGSSSTVFSRTDNKNATVTVTFPITSAQQVTFSATQDGGESGISDTTAIELNFNKRIDTLGAENISVTNANKGQLTSSNNNKIYTLTISNITVGDGETVTVNIVDIPSGYSISPSSQDVTVYREALYVIFDGNGDNVSGTMEKQKFFGGQNQPLTANGFERTGYTFMGWSTTESGEKEYDNKGSYMMGAEDVTLYAVWKSSANEMTDFAILGSQEIVTNGTGITVTMPNNYDLSNPLTPTYTLSDEATLIVDDEEQVSGNPISFTDGENKPFRVIAEDGTEKTYTVTVHVAKSSENNMTDFAIPGSLTPYEYNGTSITVTMPNNYDLSSPLNPTYTLSDEARLKVGDEEKTSGESISFTEGEHKFFTVIAEDGSQKTYTVTVNVAKSSANEMTDFAIPGSLTPYEYNGTSITVTMPNNYDLSNPLNPTYTLSDEATLKVGDEEKTSGESISFTEGEHKFFKVIAEDGSQKTYTVTVNVAKSSANNITSFKFLATNNSGLDEDVAGTIEDNAITLTVPYGTVLSSLTPTIEISDNATIDPESLLSKDFSNSVEYTVTAEDGSQKNYSVTVQKSAPSTANDITSFKFLAINNNGLNEDVDGAINGNVITLTVPYGTVLSSLIPTIVISDNATINPKSKVSEDFSSLVEYAVTAEDNIAIQTYTVVVKIECTINYYFDEVPSVSDLSEKVISGEIFEIATAPGDDESRTFVGWNISIDGSGTTYGAQTTTSIDSDIDLYAIWVDNPTVESDFIFEDDLENSGYCLKSYTGTETTVIIPSEYDGKLVTSIAANGNTLDGGGTGITDIFPFNTETIVFPNTIITIGAGACKGLSSLKSVVFNCSIEEIPDSMFVDCSNLTEINLPNSVKIIGDYAFKDASLTKIILPKNIEEIGGVAFSIVGTYSPSEIIFPASLTTIGDAAFEVSNLKKVYILGTNAEKLINSTLGGDGNIFGGLSNSLDIYLENEEMKNVYSTDENKNNLDSTSSITFKVMIFH